MRKVIAIAMVISLLTLLSIKTVDAKCMMTAPTGDKGKIFQIVKWTNDDTSYRIHVSLPTSATSSLYWTVNVKTTDPLYHAAVTALASGFWVRIGGDLVTTSCPAIGGHLGNLITLDVIK